MPGVVGVEAELPKFAPKYGKSCSVGNPVSTANCTAYEVTPPAQVLAKLFGEFCVKH